MAIFMFSCDVPQATRGPAPSFLAKAMNLAVEIGIGATRLAGPVSRLLGIQDLGGEMGSRALAVPPACGK